MKFSVLFIFVFLAVQLNAQISNSTKEGAFYQISDIPIPDDVFLEVGGMVFNDEGTLAICTRRGELWEIQNLRSSRPNFSRFAHGLHEPLGLNWKDGSYYLAQRGELTKLTDTNKDGKADKYESIRTWPLSGNYHEYSYGPKFLPNGDMILSLNLGWQGKGVSLSKWRGWVIQVSPEGVLTPLATGMRSPAGIGFNANGDLFYTENQGDWVGSGRMTHVEKGDFVGNPEGLKWATEANSPVALREEDFDNFETTTLYEYSKKVDGVKPPSVWFPHTLMGISTSDLVVIPDGFGPYTGQLLVGDQGHSKIMRVFQEKVNGVYQGVCFPFREGFESGILRMVFDQDNSLYVGMTSRGWSSTGRELYGLERLAWNGTTPFEMKSVRITSSGFDIEFTEEVNAPAALNIDNYEITDFNYNYHHVYGSPIIDQEKKAIKKIALDEGGKTVSVTIDGMRKGFIYEISLGDLKSKSNKALLHNKGYYTVNEIPASKNGELDHNDHEVVSAETNEIVSAKRPTQLPTAWTDGPDQTITMGTEPGLKFDLKEFKVKAGSKLKLVFNNNDDMLHNMLIVNPGTADKIGQMAIDLGLDGLNKGFIPESDDILFHTNLMQPHTSDAIYFEVPKKPGNYQYVCTFPGHAAIMRGVMIVE